MSKSNGYKTVRAVKNDKGGSADTGNTGRKKVWIEVKVSPEIDAKAGSTVINKRPAFGIPGKITNNYKLTKQITANYGTR